MPLRTLVFELGHRIVDKVSVVSELVLKFFKTFEVAVVFRLAISLHLLMPCLNFLEDAVVAFDLSNIHRRLLRNFNQRLDSVRIGRFVDVNLVGFEFPLESLDRGALAEYGGRLLGDGGFQGFYAVVCLLLLVCDFSVTLLAGYAHVVAHLQVREQLLPLHEGLLQVRLGRIVALQRTRNSHACALGPQVLEQGLISLHLLRIAMPTLKFEFFQMTARIPVQRFANELLLASRAVNFELLFNRAVTHKRTLLLLCRYPMLDTLRAIDFLALFTLSWLNHHRVANRANKSLLQGLLGLCHVPAGVDGDRLTHDLRLVAVVYKFDHFIGNR